MLVDPERFVLEWATGGAATSLATMAAQLIHTREADGVALRELASFVGAPSADVPASVIAAATDELGISLPTSSGDAADRLARWWARRIVAGDVSPVDGAGEIWGLSDQLESLDVGAFAALTDEWEELPEQRVAIEREIRSAAASLLSSRC